MIGPCISIFYQDLPNLLKKLERIPLKIALEIRLDMVNPDREIDIPRKEISGRTLILTVRTIDEGGFHKGDTKDINKLYGEAIHQKPDYIDIGIAVEGHDEILEMAREKGVGTILSYHNPWETPTYKELQEIYSYMDSLNPDIIKIVTFAREARDVDEVVKLLVRTRGKREITAFCMGSLGRISRIYNMLLLGAVSYLALDGMETAEGQITLDEYLKLKEVIKYV